MLKEISCADASACGFEYRPQEFVDQNNDFDYLTKTFNKTQVRLILLKEIKFYLDFIKDIKPYEKDGKVEGLFREKITKMEGCLKLIAI